MLHKFSATARLAPSTAPSRSESAPPNVIPLRERKTHCRDCAWRAHCLPHDLAGDELGQFDELVGGQVRLRKGDTLFFAGDAFHALHAIRVGTLKTSILAEDGREQIAGCHLTGEVIGVDGIATKSHTCTATALEDSEVCAIDFERLEALTLTSAALQQRMRRLLAHEVARNHGLMLLLGSMRAEERVAVFLLDLAERYHRRGYSASEFMLRMTREEIGSYLGLKLETVSRVFSRLQADGLIQAQGRDVKILDRPMLNRLLGRDIAPIGD